MNKEEANWNYETIIEEMRPAPMHSNYKYTAMKDLLKERNELKSKLDATEENLTKEIKSLKRHYLISNLLCSWQSKDLHELQAFAMLVVRKKVDILYLKKAHKLPTLQEALDIYNRHCDNEDMLTLPELTFLVEVIDKIRGLSVKVEFSL